MATRLQIFSFILLIAGFGFKISAVPFHLWTADVYEGAPVAVTSYLSVISKGAILFVLVSVLYNAFAPLNESWYNILFLISVLTMIIGNLFALRQQNMKRFLAFSSIAQVGFILNWYHRLFGRRKCISYFLCTDLYFLQPCCIWSY